MEDDDKFEENETVFNKLSRRLTNCPRVSSMTSYFAYMLHCGMYSWKYGVFIIMNRMQNNY